MRKWIYSLIIIAVCTINSLAQTITMSFPDTTAFEAEQVMLPLRVGDFNKIVSIEFTLTWDPSILEYVETEELDLPGIAVGESRSENGILRFSWFSVNEDFVTLTDSSVIALMRFNVLGEVGNRTDLIIVDLPFQPIEVAQATTSPDDVILLRLSDEQGAVTVIPEQTISVSFNSEDIKCKGADDGSIDLSIEASNNQFSINWTGPGNFTSDQASIDNLQPGTYELVITDNGNRILFEETITLVEPDTELALSNIAVENTDCSTGTGTASIIVAGGTLPYLYDIGEGPQESETLMDLQPGDYNLTITDANDCETTGTFSILEETELRIDSIVVDRTDCATKLSSAIIIISDGASPYTFRVSNGNSVSSQGRINDLMPGDYSVTVVDGNGCEGSSDFTVLEPTPPTIENVEIKSTDCEAGLFSATVLLSNGTAPFSFDLGNGPTSDSTLTELLAGTYNLTVTDAGNCEISTDFTINPLPGINVLLREDINACEGDIITLSVGDYASYNWSTSSTEPSIEISSQGRYSVTVTDENGCSSQDAISVNFSPALNLQLEQSDFVVCPGEEIQFNASGADTYQWIDTSGTLSDTTIANPIANPIAFTTYQLTASNACDEETISVDIDVLTLDISAGQDTCIGGGLEVELNASGGVSYVWQDAVYPVSNPTIPNPVVQPDESTTYFVAITDENGCTVTDTVQVIVANDPQNLDLVNLITPNGDGKNDELIIPNITKFGQNSLRIFNRWGDIVYEKVNYMLDDDRFDGTKNGSKLPVGNYYYVLSFRTIQFKQTLTLIRE